MKFFPLILLLSLLNSCKTEKSVEDFSTQDSELDQLVSYLASDDLKGRFTGSSGIDEAATYIEDYFIKNDVEPYFDTYRDSFKIGDTIDAFNVVGFVEGNDKDLKNEVIIIGAHYDHIGYGANARKRGPGGSITKMDSIANGANDNATGAAGVMALAKYFGNLKRNNRSLMFVLFTAEELGLLGSKHLAKRLKEKGTELYTLVNFEMIGVPLIDQEFKAFLTGFEFSNMASKMNEYAGSNLLGFSVISKSNYLFTRSDNYPFYETFQFPSHTISSCDLTNFKYYHHSDDEVEKLNFRFMAELINSTSKAIEVMANTPTKEIKLYEN